MRGFELSKLYADRASECGDAGGAGAGGVVYLVRQHVDCVSPQLEMGRSAAGVGFWPAGVGRNGRGFPESQRRFSRLT